MFGRSDRTQATGSDARQPVCSYASRDNVAAFLAVGVSCPPATVPWFLVANKGGHCFEVGKVGLQHCIECAAGATTINLTGLGGPALRTVQTVM